MRSTICQRQPTKMRRCRIEAEQTILQPFIGAAMIEAAEARDGDRVLAVGVVSGYAAAVVGQSAGTLIAIERHAVLDVWSQ